MQQDGEMYMLHYYIQKGWSIKEFLNQSYLEKLTYYASMQLALEQRAGIFFD